MKKKNKPLSHWRCSRSAFRVGPWHARDSVHVDPRWARGQRVVNTWLVTHWSNTRECWLRNAVVTQHKHCCCCCVATYIMVQVLCTNKFSAPSLPFFPFFFFFFLPSFLPSSHHHHHHHQDFTFLTRHPPNPLLITSWPFDPLFYIDPSTHSSLGIPSNSNHVCPTHSPPAFAKSCPCINHLHSYAHLISVVLYLPVNLSLVIVNPHVLLIILCYPLLVI